MIKLFLFGVFRARHLDLKWKYIYPGLFLFLFILETWVVSNYPLIPLLCQHLLTYFVKQQLLLFFWEIQYLSVLGHHLIVEIIHEVSHITDPSIKLAPKN